jgi:hypothetical protein
MCGKQTCRAIASRDVALFIGKAFELPTTRPAPLDSYYVLRFKLGKLTDRVFYVPAKTGAYLSTARPAPAWHFVAGDRLQPLGEIAPLIEPFPPPRISQVVINGKKVANPAAYASVFTGATPARFAGTGFRVVIESPSPNPWFGPNHNVVFSPSQDVLLIDGAALRPSPRIGALLHKDLQRTPGRPSSRRAEDRSGLWLGIGVLIGALVFVAGTEHERRRSRQTAPTGGSRDESGSRHVWRLVLVAASLVVGIGAITGGVVWLDGAWSWISISAGVVLIVGGSLIALGRSQTALWVGLVASILAIVVLIHQAGHDSRPQPAPHHQRP